MAAGHVQLGNGKFAVNIGGGGRSSDDYQTPEGEVLNSHSRSGFTNVGAGWTGEKAHVGASYGYDDTKYGIPVVEGGILQLTPRRHALTFRAGAERLTGAFEAFRATVAVRRYQHDELEGDGSRHAFQQRHDRAAVHGLSPRPGQNEGQCRRRGCSTARSTPWAPRRFRRLSTRTGSRPSRMRK